MTFHGPKVGLAVGPGRFHAGRVVVADIGLEPAPTAVVRATPAVLARVPRRGQQDSKFTAGALLVVGGAPGTTGAPVLSATAALRADAGYVTLAVPSASLSVVETLALEPVKRGFDRTSALDDLAADLERADALAIGPGLGRARRCSRRRPGAPRAIVAARGRRRGRPLRRSSRSSGTRRRCSRRTRASSPGCSTPTPNGSPRTGSRRPHALRERFGAVVLLKGAGHDRARAGRADGRLRHGPTVARDRGDGRRADGGARRVPREGARRDRRRGAAAVAHGLAARAVPHRPGLIASDVVEALPSVLA